MDTHDSNGGTSFLGVWEQNRGGGGQSLIAAYTGQLAAIKNTRKFVAHVDAIPSDNP